MRRHRWNVRHVARRLPWDAPAAWRNWNSPQHSAFRESSPLSVEAVYEPAVWLGIGWIVVWAILWLGIKMVAVAVHPLLAAGIDSSPGVCGPGASPGTELTNPPGDQKLRDQHQETMVGAVEVTRQFGNLIFESRE
jgi:hypothetical protein